MSMEVSMLGFSVLGFRVVGVCVSRGYHLI